MAGCGRKNRGKENHSQGWRCCEKSCEKSSTVIMSTHDKNMLTGVQENEEKPTHHSITTVGWMDLHHLSGSSHQKRGDRVFLQRPNAHRVLSKINYIPTRSL